MPRARDDTSTAALPAAGRAEAAVVTRPAKAPAAASRAAAKSGPARALEKLGLLCDIDLALHLPLRYEDETRIDRLADTRDGQTVQVEGVVSANRIEQRSRRQLLVHIDDGSGELVLRFLHFYPSHVKALAVGSRVRVRGELRGGFLGREMVHPTFRPVKGDTPLATALTPVYPASAQLPQAYLRKAVASALQRAPLVELLPANCVPNGLPSLKQALEFLHHPPPEVTLATLEDRSHPCWQRLKFDELLAQQLSQLQAQRERAALRAPALGAGASRTVLSGTQTRGTEMLGPTLAETRASGTAAQSAARSLHERLLAALPFHLTAAQRRVAEEIAHDLARAQPMHRLLQGDVGSGKTVVAAFAAAIAIDAGWQCALMAPTEILAEQHFRKLVGWLEPLGVGLAWLTGSQKGKARARMIESVADGSARLVVGTHAVIQERVAFQRLGLAIIDEQHRFGVQQRVSLLHKLKRGTPDPGGDVASLPRAAVATRQADLQPHLLMMSATPIPRTLSMTYFADLDVSTIDELPPGRTPIVTKLFSDGRREDVIARVREAVASGRQVYWVCPLIEESETLDLKNATETHARLAAALPGSTVGLLHGRMPAAEKAGVMALFTDGRMAVLVSTTVIEVGVDVPGASLMVIEHAERFGLSQLHQLRGRVGRGSAASVCVLLYTSPLSDTGKARLKAMAETNDGFEIARRDLEIRGPGEFMGARQSGAALLRFADLAEDDALLAQARALAPELLANHPRAARAHVERWLGGKADYLKA